MELELAPLGDVDSDDMILTRAGEIQGEQDSCPALFEERRHRVGAITERRVAGVIEHEEVERAALKFGEISTQPPRPQDAEFEDVVVPWKDDDILGHPYRLGGADQGD